ncbi:MAG: methyltransferase domain-containing protein [Syntrophobacteraceae bacterium]|nr:methyltransferase domain-containing protein [Syntrophobacteraceae bacterium]
MKTRVASSSVLARFAAAAHTYDLESRVQRAVAQKLAAMLPASAATGSVLEIGCGTGLLTELLLNRFPSAVIDALDISGPMIDAAKKRMGECERLLWHTADARRFCPQKQFELIASSSALHWMTPAGEIMERISSMLEPGGELASAVMVEGTLGELRDACGRLFPRKGEAVHLPSEEEILCAIAGAGLTIGQIRLEQMRETCGSTRELLRSLNRQGVTGRPEGGSNLLNRTELLELIEYYDRKFCTPEGGVIATYCVLYVTARKER